MERPDSFEQLCLDQLASVGDVTLRRMFGGAGLYCRGVFFAVIHRSRLYLKTDETTRPRYEEAGSEPFRPSERQTLTSYYEVPAEVLERAPRLVEWAAEAIACQERAQRKKIERKGR